MTAASNSEARKRAAEAASNSESAALATNSPKWGDDTSETANGPQNGVQGSGIHDIYCEGGRCRCFSAVDSEDVGTIPAPVDPGAIGRLNEAERAALRLQVRQALVTAWRDEYSVATVVAGVAECLEDYLADIVREHTDRALAEVESTLEAVRGLLEPHRSVDAISGRVCEVVPVHIRAKDLRAILDRSES